MSSSGSTKTRFNNICKFPRNNPIQNPPFSFFKCTNFPEFGCRFSTHILSMEPSYYNGLLLCDFYYKYRSYSVSEHHNFKPVLIIEIYSCTKFYYKYWFCSFLLGNSTYNRTSAYNREQRVLKQRWLKNWIGNRMRFFVSLKPEEILKSNTNMIWLSTKNR